MPTEYQQFVRSDATDRFRDELARVSDLAALLRSHLDEQAERIDLVHVHRAQSKAVQMVVSELLLSRLGFEEEVVIPRGWGFTTHARPDFP